MRVGLVMTLNLMDTRIDIRQTRNIFSKYF